jgi:hypothetical protein
MFVDERRAPPTAQQIRDLQENLMRAEHDLRETREQLALARKSAEDAWRFARAALRTGRAES